MKILIVDDDPDTRNILKLTIEMHGHEAIEASDGLEGLNKAKTHKPDLIISDALMPKMDGFQFLREAKTDKILRNIPFVFYSGTYTGADEVKLAISLGAEGYIIKPKKPEKFWEELSIIIEESKKGKVITADIIEKDEEYLRKYSQIVAAKLEEKVKELEKTLEECKKVEEALRNSESRYRNLVETSPAVIYSLSTENGLIASLNPAFEKITGWPREEWINKPFPSIVHPDDLPVAMEMYQRILNGETPPPYELRILSKSGEYLIGEFTSAPQIENGKTVREFGIVNDITGRKKTENNIKQVMSQQQAILNNIPDIAWLKDKESRFIAVNEPFGNACGVRPEDLAGKTDLDIWPKELAERYRADDREVITSGRRKLVEEPLSDKEGKIVWIETIKTPVYNEKNEIIGTTGIARDITERRQTEKYIYDLSLRHDAILAAVPDIIMEVDNQKVYTWANKAGYEFFGEDVIGKEAAFYFEGQQDTYTLVETLFRGIENVFYVESWQRRKDGEKRLLAWWCRVLKDESGNVKGALSSARDITDRKKMEEEVYRITQDWEETFNSITDMVTVHDKDWNIIRANKAAEKMLGLPFIEKTSAAKCFKYYHGTEKPPEGCPSCSCLKTGESANFEIFEPHLNMFIEIRAIPRFDSNNNLIGLIHVVRDITERKKADKKIENLNRVYSMLSKINETIVRVRDRNQLFEDACRIAVEKGMFKMAWIGLVEPDTSLIKPVAHFGADKGYLDIIRISSSDTPEGWGPTGSAVRERKHFICNDIEHDEIMLPWRAEALKRGYCSSAAFPLLVGKHVIGVINFYAIEPNSFNEDEVKLLSEVAEDLSFAVEFIEGYELREQTEKELKKRVDELEKFYEMAIGRELKMKGLKEEIERLKTELSTCRKK